MHSSSKWFKTQTLQGGINLEEDPKSKMAAGYRFATVKQFDLLVVLLLFCN
jgi:hypothetical protein